MHGPCFEAHKYRFMPHSFYSTKLLHKFLKTNNESVDGAADERAYTNACSLLPEVVLLAGPNYS